MESTTRPEHGGIRFRQDRRHKLLAQIEELYGGLDSKFTAAAQPAHYVGGQSLIDRETSETQVVLGFEGRAYQAKDFYASQLLSMILGGGMASRLFQEVREKRGYCYSVYAFHWGFSDTGVFGINAATGDEDLGKLMPVILDELKRVRMTYPSRRQTGRAHKSGPA